MEMLVSYVMVAQMLKEDGGKTSLACICQEALTFVDDELMEDIPELHVKVLSILEGICAALLGIMSDKLLETLHAAGEVEKVMKTNKTAKQCQSTLTDQVWTNSAYWKGKLEHCQELVNAMQVHKSDLLALEQYIGDEHALPDDDASLQRPCRYSSDGMGADEWQAPGHHFTTLDLFQGKCVGGKATHLGPCTCWSLRL